MMHVVDVVIPPEWEFWTGMYDAGIVETGIPFAPAPQPDAVKWLNERMTYWTEQT